MVDVLISAARIADGLGNPLFNADLAIEQGVMRILRSDQTVSAVERIDATGLVLAPGFIDIHAHNDLVAASGVYLDDKVLQGVTTEVNGNCGFSPFPITDRNRHLQNELLSIIAPGKWQGDWTSWSQYADTVRHCGSPTNIVGQVGHGALRSAVLEMASRDPTTHELREMQHLLDRCLEDGASGLSFGLMYSPSCFAKEKEIAALSEVVTAHQAFVSVHLRSYDQHHLIPSMREMLDAVCGAGARLLLSHLAPSGVSAASAVDPMLELVEAAVADGLDVAFDRYPYEHAFTCLSLLFPKWLLAGDQESVTRRLGEAATEARVAAELDSFIADIGYPNIRLFGSEYGPWNGLSLTELGARLDMIPSVATITALKMHGGSAPITMQLTDMSVQERLVQHPLCMIGSDGVPCRGGTHPRTFGCFARVVGPVVRRGVLTLPQAIHKMTGQPAQWLGLADRGRIQDGVPADLVLFDADTIADERSFADPYAPPAGIHFVFVGGHAVVRNGKATALRPGKMLSPRRLYS
jgi:N-acyl-D-amino-acid deacylase